MQMGLRRRTVGAAAVILALGVSACGHTDILGHGKSSPSSGTAAAAATGSSAAPAPVAGSGASSTGSQIPQDTSTPSQLGFPYLATKNTTRVAGNDPVSNAAAVALAVYPSEAAGTHPTAVALAPTDDWQAAIAASSLMGSPFGAPVLLSTPTSLPTATASALNLLAPTGDNSSLSDDQVLRIGDVPKVPGDKTRSIGGTTPYAVAANLATYEAKQRGGESTDVIIASANNPAYAEAAAGYLAESGEPLLYVSSSGVPSVTAAQLKLHDPKKLHIYVMGPSSVVSNAIVTALGKYGPVKRIEGNTPAAESVNFAEYRDPACAYGQQCAHIPHSFGWAIRSPGHGYVLLNENTPLDAAAASALSASGGYGPDLLVSAANKLPEAVLNYFLDYATPGYTSEGPTAAVYNHAWLIGNVDEISEAVQAQVDSILEVVPAK